MSETNGYFFEYMRELLGERYGAFEKAYYDKPRHKALRVNIKKIGTSEFAALTGYTLAANTLCENSFYCDVKPSRDPFYHAGLYYMQEPSAAAAVSALRPFIGERVLDLCAAPGGKSTQAAEYMSGGVIFCNDVEYKRAKIIVENAERLGVTNAVITCNTAADYRKAGFDGYFDTLIVDAPCSGGGMTRYESVPYSREIVEGCRDRQRSILDDAVHLLRHGGYMLYSTCTFAAEENEDNVGYLTALGMKKVDIPLRCGEERGIGMPEARRIYPMNFDGEGHFYCVLQKTCGVTEEREKLRKNTVPVKIGGLCIDAFDFPKSDFVYTDSDFPDLSGLNVLRIGTPVICGRAVRGGESEPHHALSHALGPQAVEKLGRIEIDGEQARAYITGAELRSDAPYGYNIATYKGYALGFVKAARSGDGECALKNKYPKYLRITP